MLNSIFLLTDNYYLLRQFKILAQLAIFIFAESDQKVRAFKTILDFSIIKKFYFLQENIK